MENVKYERTKFYFSLNRLSFIIQSSETYEIIELLSQTDINDHFQLQQSNMIIV